MELFRFDMLDVEEACWSDGAELFLDGLEMSASLRALTHCCLHDHFDAGIISV